MCRPACAGRQVEAEQPVAAGGQAAGRHQADLGRRELHDLGRARADQRGAGLGVGPDTTGAMDEERHAPRLAREPGRWCAQGV
jgi:hypothetical protein